MEIQEVKNLGEGKYEINNAVVVYNITPNKNGVRYTYDYDKNVYTSSVAKDLADMWMTGALAKILQEQSENKDA